MSSLMKTRILLKTGTASDWEQAAQNNFVPLRGEACIYLDRFNKVEENGEIINVPGIKIGDGTSTITELPFIGDDYITQTQINELFNAKIYSGEEVKL